MTHAFFKALLFLAAGSVMHAMSGELDMRKMGDLRAHLPRTHWTYLFGTLAIAGILPFAGFFSKDEILFFSFERGAGFWIVGAVAALMTSFYMFRSVFMTFYGKSRVDHETMHHVHESPPIMTIPLMILAVLSLIGGFVGIPDSIGARLGIPESHVFGEFLAPVFAPAQAVLKGAHAEGHHSLALEIILMAVSLSIAIAGFFYARYMYISDPAAAERMVERFPGLHKLVYNKYWVDEIYDILFVNSLVQFSRFLWKAFDDAVIDGIVNGVARLVRVWGGALRSLQSGFVKDYALSILVGVVVVIGYLVLR
jgi:NADH-quinone oxidoreductase subunit L